MASDSDVLVPDLWPLGDEAAQQVDALARVEVDDLDSEPAKPVDPTLEGARLTHDDARDRELADQAAAVPAGSERGRHRGVAIARAAPRGPERVGLAVGGGV